MTCTSRWLALFLAMGLWGGSSAAAEPRRPGAQDPQVCAKVTVTARFEAYAYTHVIELHNTCRRAVVCQVWTDVDPTPKQTLRAKPGERVATVTRKGSPSREVYVDRSCRFDD